MPQPLGAPHVVAAAVGGKFVAVGKMISAVGGICSVAISVGENVAVAAASMTAGSAVVSARTELVGVISLPIFCSTIRFWVGSNGVE
jgi:hypothetical protein